MKKYIPFILAAIAVACEPTELDKCDAVLTTGNAVEITSSSAYLCGGIVSSQSSAVWFELSENSDMSGCRNTHIVSADNSADVSIQVESLHSNTTYYYRLCGKQYCSYYKGQDFYLLTDKGAVCSFTTEPAADLDFGTIESWGGEEPMGDLSMKEKGHAYVDLGLSVKWATCNVGATAPEGYGDYFAWGATEPWYQPGYAQYGSPVWKSGKSAGYIYKNTPYQTANTTNYSSTKWTKYLGSTTSLYKDASATSADALKTVLDPADDAAHVNWGGSWRMPTKAEQDELRNTSNCTWTWTTLNGVNGYKVQSRKSGYTDNWIFLPAAGYRDGTYLYSVGSNGRYWSGSLYTSSPGRAYYLSFGSSGVDWNYYNRYYGLSVRPVCP